MLTKKYAQKAFALPTVLIASTILLTVLTVAAAAAVSINTSIANGIYQQLAQEAAESALARARDCLLLNNNSIPSSSVYTFSSNCNPKPAGDIDGHLATTIQQRSLVYDTQNRVSTAGFANVINNGANIIAIGYTYLLRADGSIWKTYSAQAGARKSSVVGAQSLAFSYNGCGTFFVTLGQQGVASATGANTCGQLGNGTLTNATTPTPISLPSGINVKVPTPGGQTIFTNFLNVGQAIGVIGNDGNAYVSGKNDSGQRGNGTTSATPPSTFTKFNLPAGKTAKYIAPINRNNYVITTDGYVYAAGFNTNGELGNNTTTISATPVQVQGLPTPNSSNPSTIPVSITGDSNTRHVRMQDGSVYGWGQNGIDAGGALGVNNAIGSNQLTAKKVVRLDGTSPGAGSSTCSYGATTTAQCVVDVEETGRNTYVLMNDGTVWAAGDNKYGMIGQPTTVGFTSVFRQIILPSGDTNATQISADAYQVVILTSNGNVYTAGANTFGGTSAGGEAGCGTPVSGSSTCPLDSSAQITYNGTAVNLIKANLTPLGGAKVVSIYNTSLGNNGLYMNTFLIDNKGRVWGAGDNSVGQLGNGCNPASTGTNLCSAQKIVGTFTNMKVFDGTNVLACSVQSGRGTTVIVSGSCGIGGAVYAVGYNDAGQLGDGTTNTSSIPSANRYLNTIPTTIY